MPTLPLPPALLPDEEKNLILESLAEILKNGKLPADPAVTALLTLAAVRQLVTETSHTRTTLRNLQLWAGLLTFAVTVMGSILAMHMGVTFP